MKRIFVILLFFVSLPIMAEELYPLKNDVTDISNKSWYFVTNSPNDVDEFLFKFSNKFVKEIIATDNYSNLSGQNLSIFNSIKNRWYTLGEIPSANFIIVINCSENHGILYFLWNDTQSFGSFQSTGLKTMMTYFFELNPPK